VTQFLLVRHAVNDWVKTGKLAGWTPGVHLNEEGHKQAHALGERLAKAKITALYSSPLERCIETAQAIASFHENLPLQSQAQIGEVGYGQWQGARLGRLAMRKAWHTVQFFPTRMQFPEGETMRGAQARAVDAIESLYKQYNRGIVVCVSHSDVIKMILAHYLGMHLDMFQRLAVSPASISILSLGPNRPMVERINDTSHLANLNPGN
jgi:probable phosphoglycerate mutase